MKKILLLFAAAGLLLTGITSCDSEPKNPGDFSIKAELSLSDIISLSSEDEKQLTFPINIVSEYDSIYQRKVGFKDTIFDEAGEIVEIKNDTVIIPSDYTARIHRAAPVVLPSYADTFRIDVTSNARWNAPAPTTTGNWYNAMENTTGGGDSYTTFRTIRNRTSMRATPAMLRVYTSDSMVMYIIPLYQSGERD